MFVLRENHPASGDVGSVCLRCPDRPFPCPFLSLDWDSSLWRAVPGVPVQCCQPSSAPAAFLTSPGGGGGAVRRGTSLQPHTCFSEEFLSYMFSLLPPSSPPLFVMLPCFVRRFGDSQILQEALSCTSQKSPCIIRALKRIKLIGYN